jgi:aspartokinase
MIPVWKIGGSLLPADGSGYTDVVKYVIQERETTGQFPILVTSAPKGMTTALIEVYDDAEKARNALYNEFTP